MPNNLKAVKPAGNFRDKFILMKPADTRMASGTVGVDYIPVDDDVWAEVMPIQGSAAYIAASVAPKANVQLTIRYRSDVVGGWVFQHAYTGDIYKVQAYPLDIDYRHTLLMCFCQSQKRVC